MHAHVPLIMPPPDASAAGSATVMHDARAAVAHGRRYNLLKHKTHKEAAAALQAAFAEQMAGGEGAAARRHLCRCCAALQAQVPL